MAAFATQLTEHLQQYREGRRDDAFFGLLELDHEILAELMAAFRAESDSGIRAFLVEVIWQHRRQEAIPFLGEALRSAEPAIWKQAIDGLVALASPAAFAVLQEARQIGSKEFRGWLEEAIDQAQKQTQIGDQHK
jgi:hypothetical protein